MPKKNKKPGKNGFWPFVMECRDKNPNKSQQEIETYAAQKWANMNAEQRKKYSDLAMLARDSYHPARCTSDGLEIDEVERLEREVVNKEDKMKTEISSMLRTASLANTLEEHFFLIIHVNHLTYFPTNDKYYICEVAIAAFSLKDGIEEVFHRIVKPGKLPLGYYGSALAHSKETHQLLDIVQDEPYPDDTKALFEDIIRFMKRYSTSRRLPVLYVDEKTQEMTTNVFDKFCDEFNSREQFTIYNLQYMFFVLRNAAAGQSIWPTVTSSYSTIEKDVYSYTSNICCDYHEIADLTLYCSKAIVTRYAYILCDNCCNDMNIQLIPGRHVPLNSRVLQDTSKFRSKPSSICSNVTSNSKAESVDSSGNYDDNYPPLGSSSASSMVSFSSMKSSKDQANSSKAAARIARSFDALTVTEQRPDHKNLKFPARGYQGRSQAE